MLIEAPAALALYGKRARLPAGALAALKADHDYLLEGGVFTPT